MSDDYSVRQSGTNPIQQSLNETQVAAADVKQSAIKVIDGRIKQLREDTDKLTAAIAKEPPHTENGKHLWKEKQLNIAMQGKLLKASDRIGNMPVESKRDAKKIRKVAIKAINGKAVKSHGPIEAAVANFDAKLKATKDKIDGLNAAKLLGKSRRFANVKIVMSHVSQKVFGSAPNLKDLDRQASKLDSKVKDK